MAISSNEQPILDYTPEPLPIPDRLIGENAGMMYGSLLRHGIVKAAIIGSDKEDTDHEVVNDITYFATKIGKMAVHGVRSPGSLSSGRDTDPAGILEGIRSFAETSKSNGLIIVRSANFEAPISKGCEETAVELLGIIKDNNAPKVMITGRYGRHRLNQSSLVRELNDRFLNQFDVDNSFTVDKGVVSSAACPKSKYASPTPSYVPKRLGSTGIKA